MDVTEFLTRYAAGERDFCGVNLSSANLSNATLKGVALRYANLSNVDLSNADLNIWGQDGMYGRRESPASLRGAILINANLSGANLSGVYLNKANLSGANLSGTNLTYASLQGAKFINSNLRNAILYADRLNNCSFCGADLRGTIFIPSNPDALSSKLSSANFKKAYFDKQTTKFPPNFNPVDAGMICLDVDYDNPHLIENLLSNKKDKKYTNPPSRPGQDKFKEKLCQVYNNKCAISGCDIKEILEAAHIIPWNGEHSHEVWNGLLLRADLHKLFDVFLLAINPETHEVIVPSIVRNNFSKLFETEVKIFLPENPEYRPNKDVLRWRYRKFQSFRLPADEVGGIGVEPISAG